MAHSHHATSGSRGPSIDRTSVERTQVGRLLDQLIANSDRNIGNWMLTADGLVIPIDHGAAFSRAAVGTAGRVRPQRTGGMFASQYHADSLWQSNDLTPADITEIRQRLEALSADFDHLGRGRWLEYALAVLDALAPHAEGVLNLAAGVR